MSATSNFDPLIALGGGMLGAGAAPLLAPAVLGVIGFGALGPVAGGIAASIQSGIGSVIAGSGFSVAQSVAMGGALPVIGYVVAGVAAAALVYGGLKLVRWLRRRRY
jgi:hypothetical protein